MARKIEHFFQVAQRHRYYQETHQIAFLTLQNIEKVQQPLNLLQLSIIPAHLQQDSSDTIEQSPMQTRRQIFQHPKRLLLPVK